MKNALKTMKILVTAAALSATVAVSSAANAATFTINAFDSIYGSYSGTVSGNTSAPSSYSWYSAGYYWGGNIALTQGGNVIANIVTNYDDMYTLYTGDGTIGLPSTATASLEVANGQTVSLYSTIASINGMGVCCDYNGTTPQITVGPSAPSPLAGSGLLSAFAVMAALAFTRFRRRAEAAA